MKFLPGILLACMLTAMACDRDQPASQESQTKAQTAPAAKEAPVLNFPPQSGPLPSFNGERAMGYAKDIVKFGPRPLNSANHKKVEEYLASRLKGDNVDDDTFTADTPVGKFPVHNIVAKFPGTKDGIIVVASHYDTNYPLRDTSYVGANDGASSSALLLEIADQLRGKPNDGYSI